MSSPEMASVAYELKAAKNLLACARNLHMSLHEDKPFHYLLTAIDEKIGEAQAALVLSESRILELRNAEAQEESLIKVQPGIRVGDEITIAVTGGQAAR